MKTKEQTRKLAAGCSKQGFEVADRTDEVSNIYVDETDEVSNHTYGKVKMVLRLQIELTKSVTSM
ncbi:N-ethylammeline chlorohydrolase [Streptococcus pneumoniae]|nr:N-ethylammeline chlorohydrolase [Streptococcus pneumoniae]